MFKRTLSVVMMLTLLASVLVGCSSDKKPDELDDITTPLLTENTEPSGSETTEATHSQEQATTEAMGETEEMTQEQETTSITESATQETEVITEPTEPFALDRDDVTLVTEGERFVLYTGAVSADLIQWTTDDATVATFDAGVVTAVGKGEKAFAEQIG